jgi:hypothetical protein
VSAQPLGLPPDEQPGQPARPTPGHAAPTTQGSAAASGTPPRPLRRRAGSTSRRGRRRPQVRRRPCNSERCASPQRPESGIMVRQRRRAGARERDAGPSHESCRRAQRHQRVAGDGDHRALDERAASPSGSSSCRCPHAPAAARRVRVSTKPTIAEAGRPSRRATPRARGVAGASRRGEAGDHQARRTSSPCRASPETCRSSRGGGSSAMPARPTAARRARRSRAPAG